jgi:hypothetical protein
VGRVTEVDGDQVTVVWQAKTGRAMSKTFAAKDVTIAA